MRLADSSAELRKDSDDPAVGPQRFGAQRLDDAVAVHLHVVVDRTERHIADPRLSAGGYPIGSAVNANSGIRRVLVANGDGARGGSYGGWNALRRRRAVAA